MVKAADMMIARRADTRARADFATWKMMAKLNGASALPEHAQTFLERYKALLKEKSEADATETVIQLVYRSYYGEMGGVGEPPDVKTTPGATGQGAASNVMAFKRPPPPQKPKAAGTSQTRSKIPVALIFICLVVVYTAFRYFYR